MNQVLHSKLKIIINVENEICYLLSSFHKEVEFQNLSYHFQLRVSTNVENTKIFIDNFIFFEIDQFLNINQ
jgi:hypothetical protein